MNRELEANVTEDLVRLGVLYSLKYYLKKAEEARADYEKARELHYYSEDPTERNRCECARIRFHAVTELVFETAADLISQLEKQSD